MIKVISILIAFCVCWALVFLALNFYYDAISPEKEKDTENNFALKTTIISVFIMICLLFTVFCSN